MDDAENNLRQEIRDLKAEVRHLKRIINGGITILCLVLLVLFPQLLIFVLSTVMPCWIVAGKEMEYLLKQRNGNLAGGI